MNLHPKALRAPGNRLSDPAHPQNSESLAGNLPAQESTRTWYRPLSASYQFLCFEGTPTRPKKQQHGDIRCCVGYLRWRISNSDVTLRGRVHVNMINPNGIG